MGQIPLSIAIAEKYSNQFCWLDDKRARITGTYNDVATIQIYHKELVWGRCYEFEWETVYWVMESGGHFDSIDQTPSSYSYNLRVDQHTIEERERMGLSCLS